MLKVLIRDAVSCYGCAASVADERRSMEHWWNDTDKGKAE